MNTFLLSRTIAYNLCDDMQLHSEITKWCSLKLPLKIQMPIVAKPSEIPAQSAIAKRLTGAYFHDAWSVIAAEPDLSALGQFLRAASATPSWVNALMNVRNRAVATVGLKNLGGLNHLNAAKPEADYKPGDRIGIFTLIEKTPDEVLFGDNDKHLNVVLSVHRAVSVTTGETTITLTTVVHIHNLLGRLYMLPVTPMHKMIVPSVLKSVGCARDAT